MTDLTPKQRQELAKSSWPYRVVEATRGNQTMLGAILLAVLGKAARNPPWVSSTGRIVSDEGGRGVLVIDLVTRRRMELRDAPVCYVDEFTGQLRRLADELKLPDDQREALFLAVRKWIANDERANLGLMAGSLTVH